jgi:hypothetical protein
MRNVNENILKHILIDKLEEAKSRIISLRCTPLREYTKIYTNRQIIRMRTVNENILKYLLIDKVEGAKSQIISLYKVIQ